MSEPVFVSRDQVVNCVREAGWKYSTASKRVEIYKRGTRRMDLVIRDLYPESLVRVVLKQAGLTKDQVERFLLASVK